MERIGFGRRLGAYIIDGLFVFVIAFILLLIIPSFLENLVDWSKVSDEQISALEQFYGDFADKFVILAPAMVISGFFYNLLEGLTGYTLAKLMLNIKVGNQDGSKATQNKLMLRFTIKNIGNIISLIVIATSFSSLESFGHLLSLIVVIGCFVVLGENKLSFHDMIAKTAVYNKKELENNNILD